MVDSYIYTKDINNKHILTDVTETNQVMMEWEKPYMEALVEELQPKGNVLEIGFGVGYSATAIQKHNINTHTIIEYDKNVLEKAYEWSKKQKHKVFLIEGTWQEKLKLLGYFDSFFFDDHPHPSYPDPHATRIFDFYYDIMENHANKDSTFTWYCNMPICWPCNNHIKWDMKLYNIEIPNNCNYVENYGKKINSMYIPLVTFKERNIKIHRKIIERFKV